MLTDQPLDEETAIAGSPAPGTEERLRRAASRLFAEKGYEGATVREIIEAAEVTRPVLYYYFKSKEDLFCHLVRDRFERNFQDMDDILDQFTGCRERLRELAERTLRIAIDDPEAIRILLRFFIAPPHPPVAINGEQLIQGRFARIYRIIEEGIANGELRPGPAERYVILFSSLMDMQVLWLGRMNADKLPENTVELMLETFFEGLGA